ncbi:MAG TPA: hypothetical protein VJ739_13855 [Gemmataceae bacterium]|nr:hypothetical protein [Gemmataceae bacterium]
MITLLLLALFAAGGMIAGIAAVAALLWFGGKQAARYLEKHPATAQMIGEKLLKKEKKAEAKPVNGTLV